MLLNLTENELFLWEVLCGLQYAENAFAAGALPRIIGATTVWKLWGLVITPSGGATNFHLGAIAQGALGQKSPNVVQGKSPR